MRVDGKTIQNVANINVDQVIILDASGSMSGSKYDNARKGILEEIKLCEQLGYTITVIEMVQRNEIITHCFKANPSKLKIKFVGADGSDTPLYDTIVSTFDNLLFNKEENHKYLIKVWTDGQNNSGYSGQRDAEKAIKNMENEGNTVTFICTDRDEHYIQRMGVHESNIITYNNTGEDLERKLQTTRTETINYSKRVAAGEDVTRGFYSKTIVND